MRHAITCMPSHSPKTLKCYLTYVLHIKIYFRYVVYFAHFKRFSNLNITKKIAKENAVFKLIVYCVQVKALVFSLKHKTSCNKWLKIQLK